MTPSTVAESVQLEHNQPFDCPEIIDLSQEGEKNKIARLREVHMQDSINKIFLLSGNIHSMLERAVKVKDALYDLDDTATRSGAKSMPDEVVDLLRSHRQIGIRSGGLTGRHAELINPLYENHNGDPGFDYALTELGAFKLMPSGSQEYHLSNERLEKELIIVRGRVITMQQALRTKYNVTFEKNLGGAHQSLDSHVIYKGGKELADPIILQSIINDLSAGLELEAWEVRPSSQHTIDIVPSIITKGRAMQKFLEDSNLSEDGVSYAEDSVNGLDVFQQFASLLKIAVVGAKTPDELIRYADIAVTNITPHLRFMRYAKTR